MENTYFLTRIRRTNNIWDKGTETHTNFDDAMGSFYAYMGAFGYGRHAGTDFCTAYITDVYSDNFIVKAKWIKQETQMAE